MLNLEPLVARFLDDLLRTIRRASLDELREALTTATPSAPSVRASRGHLRVEVEELMAPVATPTASRPTRKPARRKAVVRSSAPVTHATHEPHAVGEITEPERLLAVVADLPAPRAQEPEIEEPSQELEPDAPPESGERPSLAPPPRLRHGEAAVAVKGSTYVIRRAKRA